MTGRCDSFRCNLGLLLVLAAMTLPVCAQQPSAPPPCGGVFNIAAQIRHMEPADASLTRVLRTGERNTVGLNDVVCRGEMLLFTGGAAQRVVLREADRRKVLVPPQSYVAPSGMVDAATRAFSYMAGIFRTLEALPPAADIPGPTAIRGGQTTAEPLVPLQINSLGALHNLPRQLIAPDLRVVLSWREGVGPYRCEAVSRLGEVNWKGDAMGEGSWCELDAGRPEASQLAVRDGRGRLATWNIGPASWSEVPRPDWLAPHGPTLSPAESTAWAWWLWTKGGAAWRLQALAMLNQHSGTVWIAGYLRDQVLADAAQFAPG